MKIYEVLYRSLFIFALPHYQLIRELLKRESRSRTDATLSILDVGGRKSPYTIGLEDSVTIIDLPRKSLTQRELLLGLSGEMLTELKKKRSNVDSVILGDFLAHEFPLASFDMVVAVEVIEHFEDDHAFLSKCSQVLSEEGACLFTTPNGDHVRLNRESNPDHFRHYRKYELEKLLLQYFIEVDVRYFARWSSCFLQGLVPWNLRRPVQTVLSMFCNLWVYRRGLSYDDADCAFLVAYVRKPIKSTHPQSIPNCCSGAPL